MRMGIVDAVICCVLGVGMYWKRKGMSRAGAEGKIF